MLALFFFFVAPIAWMVVASLQPTQALATLPPNLTLNLWLDGYATIAGDPRWLGSLAVSLQVALLTAVFVILLAAPPAYALARYDITGKGTVLALLILVQMVPAIVMAIPVLRVFQIVGLTDTVASLVIVNVAFWLPLIIWLLRNFFMEVPVSLEKAARIDGCSRLGTLFRVTIPAARPGMAAAAILILIGTWNEFLFAVILGNRNAVPITRLITGIQNFPGALNQQPPAQSARGGGDRRRAALPAARPVLPSPDHLRPYWRVREGLTRDSSRHRTPQPGMEEESMTEDQDKTLSRLTSAVSRREVLKGGLIAGSAAFLAACGASTTSSAPSAAAPSTGTAPSAAPPARRPAPPRRRLR